MTTASEAPARHDRAAAQRLLRRTRALLDPALRSWAQRVPPPLDRVVSYHLGFTDAAGRPARSPAGKALRPALALSCAEAVGGRAADALLPALAVELTHNYSLLHDDVLDGDVTRRHRPTAWRVFGVPAALLAGSALQSQALRVLASDPVAERAARGVRWLTETTTLLIAGEQSDLDFERADRVTPSDAWAMAGRKTAVLLGCACALGALWGGAEPGRTAALRRFGTHLGLAFQLTDDLLGIWGDPAVTGKPARADLAAGKKSLPVVAALASGTPAGRRLAGCYGTPGADPQRLAALVEAAGGRAWAERAAARQLALAHSALRAAGPAPAAAAALAGLARLVAARDR
jgi:geranylgeranyl diphosphate synthase type I